MYRNLIYLINATLLQNDQTLTRTAKGKIADEVV